MVNIGAACTIFCLAVACLAGYFACSIRKTEYLEVNVRYYFLFSCEEEKSVQAGAFDVSYEGGAGYIYSYGKQEYVVLAAYNAEEEAFAVKERLNESGTSCDVLTVGIDTLTLTKRESVAHKEELAGLISTACSCVEALYQTANEVESGGLTQEGAARVLRDINAVLLRLAESADEAFCSGIQENLFSVSDYLSDLCGGVIRSGSVRYAQTFLSVALFDFLAKNF